MYARLYVGQCAFHSIKLLLVSLSLHKPLSKCTGAKTMSRGERSSRPRKWSFVCTYTVGNKKPEYNTLLCITNNYKLILYSEKRRRYILLHVASVTLWDTRVHVTHLLYTGHGWRLIFITLRLRLCSCWLVTPGHLLLKSFFCPTIIL